MTGILDDLTIYAVASSMASRRVMLNAKAEIVRLRAVILGIGDLAEKTLQGHELNYAIALCDIIFGCADALSGDEQQGDDSQPPLGDSRPPVISD